MDVLQPELLWIGGRCYRFFESTVWASHKYNDPYMEDCQSSYDEEDNLCETNIEIIPHGETKFKHIFHVAKPFFPFIIGSKHAVRKRIEADTGTNIQVPSVGKDGDIIITGSNRRGIISARNRIDLLIKTSRKKIRPTHFLSIPLNDQCIIENFQAFKDDVLNNTAKSARGVEDDMFVTPEKLHLTIGMLVLLDDQERMEAVKALESCKKELIVPILKEHGPIKIALKGVDYMNDDPAEVRVLYAKLAQVDETLQKLVDEIVDYFANLGLIEKERNTVKMHVTLMKPLFDATVSYKDRKTFDARNIISVHQNTEFGEITLKSIHISQRHTVGPDGYYQATAKVNLYDDEDNK